MIRFELNRDMKYNKSKFYWKLNSRKRMLIFSISSIKINFINIYGNLIIKDNDNQKLLDQFI